MLSKIKEWFSIENNVNLIRDILFIGSLLAALIFGLSSCSSPPPVVYAAEVVERTDISLPKIPDFKFDDPEAIYFKVEKTVVQVGSNFYAIVYEDSISSTTNTISIIVHTGFDDGINFITPVRYTETYKLSDDGTAWELVYETDAKKLSHSSEDFCAEHYALYSDSGIDYTEWQNGYANKSLVVYSTYSSVGVGSREIYDFAYFYDIAPSDYYNVRFYLDFGPLLSATGAMTSATFDIATAFANFCISNIIVLAFIALSIISFAIAKSKDSMRGV